MTILTIKKVKLTPKNTVECIYIDRDGNEITFKGENVAHPSFKQALNALVPYFVSLNEQHTPELIDWKISDSVFPMELLSQFEINTILLATASGERYVTLKGKKILTRCGFAEITSPKISLDPIENQWELIVPFEMALERVFREAEQYIHQSQLKAELAFVDKVSVKVSETFDIEYPQPEETEEAPSFIDD